LNNHKKRNIITKEIDMRHTPNQRLGVGFTNFENKKEDYVWIPASRYEFHEFQLKAITEFLRFHNFSINNTSKRLALFAIERYNKYIFLKEKSDKWKTRNLFTIFKNKNLWVSEKYREEKNKDKYSFFYEIVDEHKLKYKDVVKFVEECKKSDCFKIIDGNYYHQRATQICYNGYDKDRFFILPKNCKEEDLLYKMGQFVILSCVQENKENEITHWKNSCRELIDEENFVKIKGRSHISEIARNSNVEFEKINKTFIKTDKKLGIKFFSYTRTYRDGGISGGRMYSGITQLSKEHREKLYKIFRLEEIDVSSAQMQYVECASYGKHFSDRDMYENVFNNIHCLKKYKKYYPHLREFIKFGCSIMVNKQSATTFLMNQKLSELGLIYSDEEITNRRKFAQDLKDELKLNDMKKVYETKQYISYLKAMKDERMLRITKSHSEELVKKLKNIPQKVLKKMTYEFYDAFNKLYPKVYVDKVAGKYELPESNAVIHMIHTNKHVLLSIHDCIIVRENSPIEDIKKELYDCLYNEFIRMKKNKLSFNYKKVINLKSIKFKLIQLKNKLPRGTIHLLIYNTFPNDRIVLIT